MNDQTIEQTTVNEQQRERELSLYDQLVRQISTSLDSIKTAVDADALKAAIDKAGNELKAAGNSSVEAVAAATSQLKKDLSSSAGQLKPVLESLEKSAGQASDAVQAAGGALWETLAQGTGGTIVTWRDKSGGALAALMNGVADWSGNLGEGIDQALTYRTGEMTYGGEFRCKDCGTRMNLKRPGHLPPCPKCHKTAFRRA